MSGPDVDALVADVERALHALTDASFGEADDAAMHESSLNAYASLRELETLARETTKLEAALAEAKKKLDYLIPAAQALYERVEMDESAGICLSTRGEALMLGAVLADAVCPYCGEIALAADRTEEPSKWFVPEGDQRCGVIHTEAHATCMARKGHDGPHRNTQGTWIDGPWCEYPADRTEEGEA